jgi:hypothetical protein
VEDGGRDAEDAAGGRVHRLHVHALVEGEHPRREVRKDALEIRARVLDLLLVALHRLRGVGDLARHRVERLGEDAELVAALHRIQLRVVALGDGARRFGERRERRRQALGKHEGERQRRKEREEHRQRERQPEQFLEVAAGQQELAVVVQARLHQLRIAHYGGRRLLQHLENADVVGDREDVHGNHDPQVHAAIGNVLDLRDALLRADLAQHVRARKVRKQRHGLDARLRDHAAARGEKRGLFDGKLLAQAIERGDFHRLRRGQRARHGVGLVAELLQRVLQRVLRELQATAQGLVHAHVEPRLDRPLQELERDRVHQPPGMSAISANTTMSRRVSFEPNTRSRSLRRRIASW